MAHANLTSANLSSANLITVYLMYAKLKNANLADSVVYSVDDDPGFRDVDPPAKQAIRVRA